MNHTENLQLLKLASMDKKAFVFLNQLPAMAAIFGAAGAGTGALTAKLTDRDVGKGALYGAAAGALPLTAVYNGTRLGNLVGRKIPRVDDFVRDNFQNAVSKGMTPSVFVPPLAALLASKNEDTLMERIGDSLS